MCKLIESRSYGDLYADVSAWGNALCFMRDTLRLPIHRVAVSTMLDRRWRLSGPELVESPCVYFETADGFEVGCWVRFVDRLQVFAAPRRVHSTMRANKTLWSFAPDAQIGEGTPSDESGKGARA